MFDKVMDWLERDTGHADGAFHDEEIRVAVAALFYHVIAVDGEITASELARLESLLSSRYNLTDEQLQRLTKEGREMEASTAGIFPFTVILNRQLDELERHRIYSQLQALAMADGKVEELERDLLQHLKQLLKLG